MTLLTRILLTTAVVMTVLFTVIISVAWNSVQSTFYAETTEASKRATAVTEQRLESIRLMADHQLSAMAGTNLVSNLLETDEAKTISDGLAPVLKQFDVEYLAVFDFNGDAITSLQVGQAGSGFALHDSDIAQAAVQHVLDGAYQTELRQLPQLGLCTVAAKAVGDPDDPAGYIVATTVIGDVLCQNLAAVTGMEIRLAAEGRIVARSDRDHASADIAEHWLQHQQNFGDSALAITSAMLLKDINAKVSPVTWRLIIGGVILGLVSTVTIAFVMRYSVRSLLMGAITDLVEKEAELAKLATSLHVGESTLKHTRDISETSQSTLQSMDQVVQASHAVTEQISSVSQTATQIAQRSVEAKECIQQFRGTLESVTTNARNGADAAGGATEQAAQTSETVAKLSHAAKEIDRVTELIGDIANQTNLLALNATIEAASAGEAGKGFAIVAGEVKALAGQSAEAAESIAERIVGIQTYTNSSATAVTAVGEVIEDLISQSVAIADQIEEQFGQIAEASQRVGDTTQGISTIVDSFAGLSDRAQQMAQLSQDVTESARASLSSVNEIRGIVEASEDTAQAVDGIVDQLNDISKTLCETVQVQIGNTQG